jgi:hypothetical protein
LTRIHRRCTLSLAIEMARPRGRSKTEVKQKAKNFAALSDDEQSDIGDSSLPLRVGPISPSEHSDNFEATNGDDFSGKSGMAAEDMDEGEEDEDDEDEEEDV